ncbi:MAG: sporulation protein YabP [Oscillospiraceae bacterium]
MMNEAKGKFTNHNVIMENRKSVSVSGVTDVDNFDEKTILIYTQMGELIISGKNLHVNSMSIETGEMTIEGEIYSLAYGDRDKHGPVSFLGKLFR